MKKIALIFLFLLCFLGSAAYYNKKCTPKYRNCVHLPVSFFPFKDQPLIKVKIENKTYSLHVDLGSSHPVDLQQKSLEKIFEKKLVGVFNYIGIKGKVYPVQAFELPTIHLTPFIAKGIIG